MTNCSKNALAEVSHTDWSSVVDCVQLAGGLDEDVMNVRLQEQLDRQQGSYNLRQIPMIHIGGTPYEGEWEVKGILDSVCTAYQRVFDITPIACDFCSPCQDVRKCLWYLNCDDQLFSLDTFQPGAFQKHQQNTSNSTTTTTTTTNTAASASNAQGNSEDDTAPQPLEEEVVEEGGTSTTTKVTETTTTTTTTREEKSDDFSSSNTSDDDDGEEPINTSGFFIGGILAGLIVGLVPAYCFARDEKRTRRDIAAALAARQGETGLGNSQGSYHDDMLQLSLSTGLARPTEEELQNMEDITLDAPDLSAANFEAAAIEIVAPYKDHPEPKAHRHRTGASVRQKKPTLGFKSKVVKEFV